MICSITKNRMMQIMVICILLILSCTNKSKILVSDDPAAPPNGVLLSNNKYIDRTEVVNAFWGEYQHWTKTIYGEESSEYKSTFPAKGVWNNINSKNHNIEYPIDLNYDSIPQLWEYAYYPIVGISKFQAEKYCKWRTDRVAEMLLIKNGTIDIHKEQNLENHFTLEKFLNGKYFDYPLPSNIDFKYAVYSLPLNEDMQIAALNKNYKENNTKHSPIALVDFEKLGKNELVHLFDNVSELTQSGVWGGNWKDGSSNELLLQYNQDISTINAWTGFRCVSVWVSGDDYLKTNN